VKHRTFVDEMDTPSYGAFWEALRQGHARSGEFKRIGKNGKVVYLQVDGGGGGGGVPRGYCFVLYC
jgi:hypothetical protein